MTVSIVDVYRLWLGSEDTTKAEVARQLDTSPRTVSRRIDRANQIVDSLDNWPDQFEFVAGLYGVTEDEVREIYQIHKDFADIHVDDEEVEHILGEIGKECIEGDVEQDADVEYRILATRRSISITRLLDGRVDNTVVIDHDNDSFQEVFDLISGSALDQATLETAYHLCSPKKMVENVTRGRLKIDVTSNTILYQPDDKSIPPYPVSGRLSTRIVETIKNEGVEGAESLMAFMENLMKNPSNRAVKELYGFLEHNDIEITKDGYFLAWKRVRDDYLDVYSGTMDNSPGKEVRVDRNQVDEDSSQTCSYGLHVCAKSYLPYYSGSRVVVCKVHPADVVAVPTDYRNAKLRCSGYKVVEDATDTWQSA